MSEAKKKNATLKGRKNKEEKSNKENALIPHE